MDLSTVRMSASTTSIVTLRPPVPRHSVGKPSSEGAQGSLTTMPWVEPAFPLDGDAAGGVERAETWPPAKLRLTSVLDAVQAVNGVPDGFVCMVRTRLLPFASAL
ncbi:MAG: hypothetical protein AO394_05595 [Candidatus Fermentibacter daniensis]|nr:MAG: hypothetical protein AO394_05595 [Candidatus Fermentibacter daniensis]